MRRLPVQLILRGPPGAGKGTQAARLARCLGLAHINPGRILRDTVARESPLSREPETGCRRAAGRRSTRRPARTRAPRGAQPRPGVHPRRYPRTARQARSLQRTLAGLDRLRRRLLVVWLQAARTSSPGRLRNRARCEHRSDDSEGAVRHRLELYRDDAQALRDALEGWTDVIEVDADQPTDSIAEEIVRALSHHAP